MKEALQAIPNSLLLLGAFATTLALTLFKLNCVLQATLNLPS